MSNIKSYKVYLLEQTSKGEYHPSLEKQLAAIKKHFQRIYGVEPEELLIGPIKQGDQVFVREGLVYIPLPEQIEIHIEGYAFMTGYDTENPELKT